MKKIFIKAYSQNNLGDDLFIYMLCNRYPQHSFIMPCSRKFKKSFAHIANLKTIPVIPYIDGIMQRLHLPLRLKRSYYRQIMRQCDFTVQIGGSLFIETLFPENEINQFQKDVDSSESYFLLGTNFGPFKNESFPIRMAEIFRQLNDICFREQYSYDLFKYLPNTSLAPDIVFGLDTIEFDNNNNETHIIVSVINLENRPILTKFQNDYENKIVEISQKAISSNIRVTLMSFCQFEGDEIAIQRINKKLNGKAQMYFYKDNLKEALCLLNTATGIVATRFHALILAWVFNCNVYPICYSAKMTNVLNDVNYPGYYSEMESIKYLETSKVFSQLLENKPFEIDKYKRESLSHFSNLDSILSTE